MDRMKHLLSTGDGADVHFLVGDGDEKELLPAHQLILKSASDVFEAMFRFDAKKERPENVSVNCPDVVEIPDIEAAEFKVMLSFIYTEDLSDLNGDNAMAVLYAVEELLGIYQFNSHPNIYLHGIPGLYSLKFPSHGRIFDWNKAKGNQKRDIFDGN
ncbi:hypothetical protein niasHS_004548 [Heterodera schachtii]|uniref:BTB domain-containing protein n=1 Tax=Heterodera schachtii TaxID=97005 RepID=A0ABD2JMI4_HETSC